MRSLSIRIDEFMIVQNEEKEINYNRGSIMLAKIQKQRLKETQALVWISGFLWWSGKTSLTNAKKSYLQKKAFRVVVFFGRAGGEVGKRVWFSQSEKLINGYKPIYRG